MKKLIKTLIRFPEINLETRDAHKLRGYFGNLFKEYSPLLHNHFADGSLRYAYPLVQFKVIEKIPCLLGLNEGSELLIKLFLQIKELNIEGKVYPVHAKNIEQQPVEIKNNDVLLEYQFKTLWIALNQDNFKKYITLDASGKSAFLDTQLRNNILSFYKGIGYWTEDTIMAKSRLIETTTSFKNKKLLAFKGGFISNALIPDYCGIGKAVSRGFGTIIKRNP